MGANRINPAGETVLFRIWLYQLGDQTTGVIDLMSKDVNHGEYLDKLEAEIVEDEYSVLRIVPRNEGKDIPENWYPIIETKLLAPLSTKAIALYKNHLFGQGKLRSFVDSKFHVTENELRDVKIISPENFQREGGGLQGDNLPDTYEIPSTPSPTIFMCHSSKDKPFVRRLAGELENNSISVWIDEKDILVGQSFIQRIHEGLKTADFVAVVLTPNFLTRSHFKNIC